MKDDKENVEKFIGWIVLILIAYIIINHLYYSKQASDYQDACISVGMQNCHCVTNAYYNEQVLRKIGILPMYEVCKW